MKSRRGLSDRILNPYGPFDFVWVVMRKRGGAEFWDVDSVGLTLEAAFRKAELIDEMKPEWAEKHPVVRAAKGRFVEEEDTTLLRE